VAVDRRSAVLEAMADAAGDGSESVVDRVCAAAVSLLALRGAGLSLMVDGDLRGTAGVSEPGIAAVRELQLTLGQGPCVEAWVDGQPVLEPDLADPSVVRWPAFAVIITAMERVGLAWDVVRIAPERQATKLAAAGPRS